MGTHTLHAALGLIASPGAVLALTAYGIRRHRRWQCERIWRLPAVEPAR